MPPKPPPKGKKDNLEATSHFRARISARQQQKREQALKKEREKEAAEALLGKEHFVAPGIPAQDSFRYHFLISDSFAFVCNRGKPAKEEVAGSSENDNVVGSNQPGS